jgi:hypothetical protein
MPSAQHLDDMAVESEVVCLVVNEGRSCQAAAFSCVIRTGHVASGPRVHSLTSDR